MSNYSGSGSGSAKRGNHSRTIVTIKNNPSDLQVQLPDDLNVSGKQEEWTTSKKVINHKTKQVETRVQRQIIMEDGKVIADSGPQITTRTKEDNKTEESENSSHKKNGEPDTRPGSGYVAIPGTNQVVSEKTETNQTMREAKRECMQFHDESFEELTGYDIHKKALVAPNELIRIEDEDNKKKPKGKLMHYSSKSHKIMDKEEMKETSKLDRKGKMTTETTRTHHHEEVDDDELPENEVPPGALPEVSAVSTRKVEYLKDYEDDEFPDAIRERVEKRAIEAVSKNYASENVVKTDTNRWVESHFGSDTSDEMVESNRTAIKHRASTPRSHPIRTYDHHLTSSDRRSEHISGTKSLTREKKIHTVDHNTRNRNMSNEAYDYHSRTLPIRIEKEDASVQASFSSEDSSDEEDGKITRQTSRPTSRTFYFGDDRDPTYRRASPIDTRIKSQNKSSALYHKIEKDDRIIRRSDYEEPDSYIRRSNDRLDLEDGVFSVNVQNSMKSTRNNRVISDKSTNEGFTHSLKGPRPNLNRLLDRSWRDDSENIRSSNDDRFSNLKLMDKEYYHPIDISNENHYHRRKDASHRQQTRYYESTPPPPPHHSESPLPELIKADNYNHRSESPHSPGGTWTKTRSRKLAPLITDRDNFTEWPDFSPLTSPLEIKNMTYSYQPEDREMSRTSRLNEHKERNIEVRRWDDRY